MNTRLFLAACLTFEAAVIAYTKHIGKGDGFHGELVLIKRQLEEFIYDLKNSI